MSPEGGKPSWGDNPSYHTLTRLIIVLLHRLPYTVPASGLFPCLPGEPAFRFAAMLLLCSKGSN
jgi:hypothetical protein